MSKAPKMVKLTLPQAHQLTKRALISNGLNEESAVAIADNMTGAERDGCKSHGLFRLPGYVASLRSGKVSKTALPTVNDVAPGVVKVDAQYGYAPLAIQLGHQLLEQKAREQGIACLQITNCFHFAAVWPDVEPLANKGLVAFAFLNSMSFVAHPGCSRKLYGTNPMAFAWPRGADQQPLIWDQASSAMARGDMEIAARDGHSIPLGYAVDEEGEATTDPSSGLAGAQLPFGGHKGGSIALMIELMAVGMCGGQFAFEARAADNGDGGPTCHGEVIIAIDPCKVHGSTNLQAMHEHVELLFQQILQEEGARLPSDRRYKDRLQTPETGIEIPSSLHETIISLIPNEDDAKSIEKEDS